MSGARLAGRESVKLERWWRVDVWAGGNRLGQCEVGWASVEGLSSDSCKVGTTNYVRGKRCLIVV